MNPKIQKFNASDSPFPFAKPVHWTTPVRATQALLRAPVSDVHVRFLSAEQQGIDGHGLGGRRWPSDLEA